MRRDKDFYPTPAAATLALLRSEVGPKLFGNILEPCVGAGDMSRLLVKSGVNLFTADIDPQWPADVHCDASNYDFRTMEVSGIDWVVTNPPFNCGLEILKNLLPQVNRGVAMLLRVTFLEPTIHRGSFLVDHPPSKIIHMPRVSFTGDGKTDSAHAAWIVWDKYSQYTLPNEWVTKEMMSLYSKETK